MFLSRNLVVSVEYFRRRNLYLLNSGQRLNSLCMTLITGVDVSIFGTVVKQTDCSFQFKNIFADMSCILKVGK